MLNTLRKSAATQAVVIIVIATMIATGLAVPVSAENPAPYDITIKVEGADFSEAVVTETMTVTSVGKVNGKIVVEQGGPMKPSRAKGTLIVKLKKKFPGYLTWKKIKSDKNFKKGIAKFLKKNGHMPKNYRIKMKRGQRFWNSGSAGRFHWLDDFVGSRWTSVSKSWIRISMDDKGRKISSAKKESCGNKTKLGGGVPKNFLKYGSYELVLKGKAKTELNYNEKVVKKVQVVVYGIATARCKHDWTNEVHVSAAATVSAIATGYAELTVVVRASSEAEAKRKVKAQLTAAQKAKLLADAKAAAAADVSINEKLTAAAKAIAVLRIHCDVKPPTDRPPTGVFPNMPQYHFFTGDTQKIWFEAWDPDGDSVIVGPPALANGVVGTAPGQEWREVFRDQNGNPPAAGHRLFTFYVKATGPAGSRVGVTVPVTANGKTMNVSYVHSDGKSGIPIVPDDRG
ncbi:MAG: hypothetical protein LBC95_02480 [Candidatus Nomurabacteria bacterium]|nr:hypothetical protein [Candidatus Nomurabacteria bacterium]